MATTTTMTTNDGLKRGLLALLAMTGVAGGVMLALGAAEKRKGTSALARASNPVPKPKTVSIPVSKYRDATDHLFTLTRDYHSCVNAQERAAWAEQAARAVERYAGQTCARATERDLADRKNALAQIEKKAASTSTSLARAPNPVDVAAERAEALIRAMDRLPDGVTARTLQPIQNAIRAVREATKNRTAALRELKREHKALVQFIKDNWTSDEIAGVDWSEVG